MRSETLKIFSIFKGFMEESDAKTLVQYLEDTNEQEIVKAVERSAKNMSTKEDIANLKAEMKGEFSNHIKWMFVFWVTQLGAMFAFLQYFSK